VDHDFEGQALAERHFAWILNISGVCEDVIRINNTEMRLLSLTSNSTNVVATASLPVLL
jgi:hypothetical protein